MDVIVKSKILEEKGTLSFFAERMKYIVEALGKDLNLTGLNMVMITDDFYNDVLDAQAKYGLISGVTKNGEQAAFGKCVMKPGENEYEVYLRIEVISCAFENSKKKPDLSVYLIRHELCHVHDHNQIGYIVGTIKPGIVERDLYTALILWEEYIVNYLSASVYPSLFEYNLSATIENYTMTQEIVRKAIQQYKIDEDSRALYNNIYLPISNFTTSLCYFFGLTDGDNCITSISLLEKHLESIQDTRNFMKMHIVLNSLRRQYPKWHNENDLYMLFKVFCDIWECFGVRYEIKDKKAYFELC